MNNKYKELLRLIKKYKKIVICRHIGVDPDAMAAELSLKQVIKNNFDDKEVYAVGAPTIKFKYMGSLDKINVDIATGALLIVLDTPDKKRLDVDYLELFDYIFVVDHHPNVEDFCNDFIMNETASSTCEILLDFMFSMKLKIDDKSAELLYQGIVSDSNRFTIVNTSYKTFELVTKLIKVTKINFTELYDNLYLRPLNEIRLQGFIAENLIVSDNGLGHIILTKEILKNYNMDTASSGGMINEFGYINEILVWAFITEDVKNNIYKITIRSRGPVINEIASKYNGGGHERASGARVKTLEEAKELLMKLDNLCEIYKGETDED